MRAVSLVVVVAVLSTTALAACERADLPLRPSAAGAGAADGGILAPEVPFAGRFAGRLTSSVPADPPLLSNLIEASGLASQLGRFTLEIPHVVDTTTRAATGTYEFIAANGDRVTATFTGLATVVAPGVVSVADVATVTGGTGRFEHATGSFTVERIFTFATGEVTGVFEGAITPASASRR